MLCVGVVGQTQRAWLIPTNDNHIEFCFCQRLNEHYQVAAAKLKEDCSQILNISKFSTSFLAKSKFKPELLHLMMVLNCIETIITSNENLTIFFCVRTRVIIFLPELHSNLGHLKKNF